MRCTSYAIMIYIIHHLLIQSRPEPTFAPWLVSIQQPNMFSLSAESDIKLTVASARFLRCFIFLRFNYLVTLMKIKSISALIAALTNSRCTWQSQMSYYPCKPTALQLAGQQESRVNSGEPMTFQHLLCFSPGLATVSWHKH